MIFGSDNQAGASATVLKAVVEAYTDATASAYGADRYSRVAVDALRDTFETDLVAYFVVSGTAANTLALSAMVQPWDGIVCHHQAHILLDESSAPALITGGAGLLPVPSRALKILPVELNHMLDRLPNEPPHNIRPAALSISQANEGGQVYTAAEVAELSGAAKARGLHVHMDGARFANAVAALDCRPADITWRAGVDVLCLGATKNGAIAAEAIIFFDRSLAEDFSFRLKRTGHLVSKSRLFGAQFTAWLGEDHWLDLARQANQCADYLRQCIGSLDCVRLAFDAQSNETFVILPQSLYHRLIAEGATMYEWYLDALPEEVTLAPGETLARMVTSFATHRSEVDAFVNACRRLSQ